jgi:hypothetical protein
MCCAWLRVTHDFDEVNHLEGFGVKRRHQLNTGLREANAEIQSGSYLSRIDRHDDFDRGVVHRVGGFSKQHASSASGVNQSTVIEKI